MSFWQGNRRCQPAEVAVHERTLSGRDAPLSDLAGEAMPAADRPQGRGAMSCWLARVWAGSGRGLGVFMADTQMRRTTRSECSTGSDRSANGAFVRACRPTRRANVLLRDGRGELGE